MKHLHSALRIKAVHDEGEFEAYGSVFNNIDLHKDIVLPGAFANSLKKHSEDGTLPKMLWQHDSRNPIGVFTEVKEDDTGLLVKGRLALDVQLAKEAHALMKMGAVGGMSIGFNVPKNGEEYDEKHNVWHIKEVDLWEVSVVTFPANPAATISAVKNMDDPREFERQLRDVFGLSQSQAKRLMAKGFSAMVQRDVDDSEAIEALKQSIHLYTGA